MNSINLLWSIIMLSQIMLVSSSSAQAVSNRSSFDQHCADRNKYSFGKAACMLDNSYHFSDNYSTLTHTGIPITSDTTHDYYEVVSDESATCESDLSENLPINVARYELSPHLRYRYVPGHSYDPLLLWLIEEQILYYEAEDDLLDDSIKTIITCSIDLNVERKNVYGKIALKIQFPVNDNGVLMYHIWYDTIETRRGESYWIKEKSRSVKKARKNC